jgi:hypothetical protein
MTTKHPFPLLNDALRCMWQPNTEFFQIIDYQRSSFLYLFAIQLCEAPIFHAKMITALAHCTRNQLFFDVYWLMNSKIAKATTLKEHLNNANVLSGSGYLTPMITVHNAAKDPQGNSIFFLCHSWAPQ